MKVKFQFLKGIRVSAPEEINTLSSRFSEAGWYLSLMEHAVRCEIQSMSELNFEGNNKNMFFNYIELRKKGMVNEYLDISLNLRRNLVVQGELRR